MQFKPTYYKSYVDDIFCLFETEQLANQLKKYLNSRHKSMNFSLEKGENSGLSFCFVKIITKETFTTLLYKEATYSGLYVNCKSHVPETYKKGLIFCLLFTFYWELIHEEICKLKCILLKNKYPLDFINLCISVFLY